jgi:CRISPR/Cas system-associated protein Cas10 (large subunit of type III CRISPR-Cas system)
MNNAGRNGRKVAGTKKCKECGKRFLRNLDYDYEVCPDCLERNRAQRDAPKTEEQLRAWREEELARAKTDWSHSILETCKVCKNNYKATLTVAPAAKICPDCQRASDGKPGGQP